jgi:hypothetical protein
LHNLLGYKRRFVLFAVYPDLVAHRRYGLDCRRASGTQRYPGVPRPALRGLILRRHVLAAAILRRWRKKGQGPPSAAETVQSPRIRVTVATKASGEQRADDGAGSVTRAVS